MDYNFWLAALNLLVAFIGVTFMILTLFGWRQLKALRKGFATFKQDLQVSQHRMQKALQRVVASYGVADPDQRIALLRSAVAIDPAVFNGYNALGYAYLDKGDTTAAITAFLEAVHQHSQDKEGYFDLARAFLSIQRTDLAEQYLRQAIQVDPSSREDIEQDAALRELLRN